MSLQTSYYVEQLQDGRWWRLNGWYYNKESAVEVAQRCIRRTALPVRIVRIRHTEPRPVKQYTPR